jgi:hypothetical protein
VNFARWAFIAGAVVVLCTLGAIASQAQTTLELSLGTSTDELNAVGAGGQTIDINNRTCLGSTCIFGIGNANTSNPGTGGTYELTSPTFTAFSLTGGAAAGFGGANTLTAKVDRGSITPELPSIFLFGSGLVALGYLLKRRA